MTTPVVVKTEPPRNPGRFSYRPFDAHRRAVARRARPHRRRLEINTVLR
jgi:IS30 family transposase